MFDLNCRTCRETYLVGARAILSLHNTSDGPVAYARCPHGHVNVVEFGRSGTLPDLARDATSRAPASAPPGATPTADRRAPATAPPGAMPSAAGAPRLPVASGSGRRG